MPSKSNSKSNKIFDLKNINNSKLKKRTMKINLDACKWATGRNKKETAVCIKKMNDCYLNKCYHELKNKEHANLTDDEREMCNKKHKDDYKNLAKCYRKILQPKDFNNYFAKLNHCEANKCSDMKTYMDQIYDNLAKSIDIKMKKKETPEQRNEKEKYNQCILKNCKKENYDPDELSKTYRIKKLECQTKYDTFKEQQKCNKKHELIGDKLTQKYNKCSEKYCSTEKLSSNQTK
jgi:hypothetical protein